MGLDRKFSQEYPVHAGDPQGSILSSMTFLLYIIGFSDDAIFNIVIYADYTTVNPKCEQASDFW